jgi:hypothetical protein
MKNLKTKMFVLSVLLLGITIVSLGLIELFNKVEIKSVEAAQFIQNPAEQYVDTSFDILKHLRANRGLIRLVDMTVREKIIYYADIFGVDKDDALRIAECESRFNPEAENVNGSATGVYQFIRKTWKDYCNGDVKNPDANIICFVRLYPKHPEWWDCQ